MLFFRLDWGSSEPDLSCSRHLRSWEASITDRLCLVCWPHTAMPESGNLLPSPHHLRFGEFLLNLDVWQTFSQQRQSHSSTWASHRKSYRKTDHIFLETHRGAIVWYPSKIHNKISCWKWHQDICLVLEYIDSFSAKSIGRIIIGFLLNLRLYYLTCICLNTAVISSIWEQIPLEINYSSRSKVYWYWLVK